jgi:hypothetical protein
MGVTTCTEKMVNLLPSPSADVLVLGILTERLCRKASLISPS